MGLMDTVKGWFGGNKDQMKAGVDKGAGAIKDKVPEEHADKVDQGADVAKDAIDKID